MLRYAGGKQRAIKQLSTYIPAGDVLSPFFGGGSFERFLQEMGHTVLASDIDTELVNYWNVLHTQRAELKRVVEEWVPMDKTKYAFAKQTLGTGTSLERAAKYFVVNRCCFSGCMTGGYSGSRFTPSSIETILTTPSLPIRHMEYEEALKQYPSTFAYLDPPYDVPNLYRSVPFNHERLAAVLKERKAPWILCYNDTPRIRSLYEGWCTIEPIQWAYGMNRSKQSNEVIIRRNSQ